MLTFPRRDMTTGALTSALVIALVGSVGLTGWGAQPVSGRSLGDARRPVDATFQGRLRDIATRCEELGLVNEATETRRFVVTRIDNRHDYFLPAATPLGDLPPDLRDAPSGDSTSDASKRARAFWWEHFTAARREYAAALYELAVQHVEHDPGATYPLLYEICWLDPDHAAARTVLGFRLKESEQTDGGEGNDGQPSGRWYRGSDRISVSVGRTALRDYGFLPRQYWRVTSEHFRVLTNTSETRGRELVELLERLHAGWEQAFFDYWGHAPSLTRRLTTTSAPPRRTPKRHVVVLFADREQYVRQLTPLEPLIEKTIGYYFAPRRTAYLYDAADPRVSAWRHEVAHQLFAETLNAEPTVGERSDFWVVEALALYVESYVEHDDYITLGGPTARRLQFARYRALREGFRVPLEQLTAWGRREIQAHERLGALYSQFAGIAHFMLDGESTVRRGFLQYARDTYLNQAARKSLESYIGEHVSDFDRRYLSFLDVHDDALRSGERPQSLCLTRCTVSAAGLRRLDLSAVQWLDLSDTEVGDEILPILTTAQAVEQLSLERTSVTADALPAIGKLRQMRELELSGLPLAEASLAPISGLQQLEALWLAGTGVGDQQLLQLASLRQLRTLDVKGCPVTPQGKAALLRRLPQLQISGP